MLCMTAFGAMALPVKKGVWKTLTLKDGTEVRARFVGDEHCRYWLGADGKRYVDSDGQYTEMTDLAIREGKAKFQKNQRRRMARIQKAAQNRASVYTGEKKGLIILAQFSDVKFHASDSHAFYDKVVNQPNYRDTNGFVGSVHDYFLEQSYGKFQLTFDVLGPVTVSGTAATYGRNRFGNDVGAGTFVAEAIKLAQSQVTNWEQYDWNNDGEIDQVVVIYAGYSEADGGGEDKLYPHEWYLSSSEYAGAIPVAGDLYIDTYAIVNERAYTGNYVFQYDGLGGICHEFSHCLGLPDTYCTDYSGYSGMGDWDLMDSGCFNGSSFVPAGFTSMEKMLAGWIQPAQLTATESIPAMQSLVDSEDAYIIYNKGHRDEYYLLENRQPTGFDAALPGRGLLITHIDYDADIWLYNLVNTDNADPQYPLNDHPRCAVVSADGKDYYDKYTTAKNQATDEATWQAFLDSLQADMAADIYPQPANNQLTNTSCPRAFTYNKNSDGRKLMNVSITQITQNADGTIAFRFAPDNTGSGREGDNTDHGDGPVIDPVKPSPDETLFYESFDLCDGKGGNDGLWKGTIASSAFSPDHDGWVAEKAYGADQCARFGTSSVSGSATTPTFQLTDTTLVTFKAAAWDSSRDGTTLKLTATNGATILPETLTLSKGEWKDCTATLVGAGSTAITFTLEGGRLFLDEVFVALPKGGDEPEEPETPEDISKKMDIDHDGAITVNDIVSLINIYLNAPAE